MKKFIASVLFAAVIGTAAIVPGAFAQSWYNSYAEGVDENLLINVGVGYPLIGVITYDLGIPPLTASVDFKLPIAVPITVGAGFTFMTETYSYDGGPLGSTYKVDVTYTDLWPVARVSYHFGFVKKLDVYAGLNLGWRIQLVDVKYGSAYDTPGTSKDTYKGGGGFLIDLNAGCRFFFTKNIGAYLELDFIRFRPSAGLTLKF